MDRNELVPAVHREFLLEFGLDNKDLFNESNFTTFKYRAIYCSLMAYYRVPDKVVQNRHGLNDVYYSEYKSQGNKIRSISTQIQIKIGNIKRKIRENSPKRGEIADNSPFSDASLRRLRFKAEIKADLAIKEHSTDKIGPITINVCVEGMPFRFIYCLKQTNMGLIWARQ